MAAQPDDRKLAARLRPYYAELLGTFALTLAAAGGEVIAQVSGGEVSHAARAVAPALVVLALIYAIGDASGAHFNPAVTFAFAARGRLPLDARPPATGPRRWSARWGPPPCCGPCSGTWPISARATHSTGWKPRW